MELNYVLIAFAVILVVSALVGYSRGLVRSLFVTFALVVAIVLAVKVMPYVSDFLLRTPLNDQIHEAISEAVSDRLELAADGLNQDEAIDELQVPEGLKTLLKQNNNAKMYETLGISKLPEYVAAYITRLIINGIALLGAFLVIYILLRIVGNFLDAISKAPILSGLNRFAGLIFGLATGAILLWLVCIVVTIFAGTKWGGYILGQIGSSVWLSFFYNNNYLLQVLGKI